MANIVPRDDNCKPQINDSFKVGSKCLIKGLYKHACGIGQTPFDKDEEFQPHVVNHKQNNVTATFCNDQYADWILVKITD